MKEAEERKKEAKRTMEAESKKKMKEKRKNVE